MSDEAPTAMSSGRLTQLGEVTIAPFSWPGLGSDQVALRDERKAWWDVLRASRQLLFRRLRRRNGPVLIVSHAPPRGVGDAASDPYHLGYNAPRGLLDRRPPPLGRHAHTTSATDTQGRDGGGATTVANVTGSVVVELVPPGAAS